MTVSAERDGDLIAVEASLVRAERMRAVPGARWDSRRQRWTYGLSWATCIMLRGEFGEELYVGPALAAWATTERERVQSALAVRDAEYREDGDQRLYPFQQAGVAFLSAAGSALLADEMGIGKTVQAISALEELDSYPALVVCPSTVRPTWGRELAKWAPHRRVLIPRGGTKQAEADAATLANGAADVLVVNWEMLRLLTRLAPYGSIHLAGCTNCDPSSTKPPSRCQREDKVLNQIRWNAVIADEAHHAKEPKAQQTRALWAVARDADRRIALTGTPIANSAKDLWSVMHFVDPLEWPAKWPWLNRYANVVPNIFSGGVDVLGLRPDRREELDKFFLPRFLRRTKAQVLAGLPEKVYERREVELKSKQHRAYRQMEREMVAAIEGGVIAADSVLTATIRLRQLASAYGEVTSQVNWKYDPDDPKSILAVEKQVRLSEPSSKLDALEEVLTDLGGKQAVVFAESSQLIDLAAARLEGKRSFGRITGDVGEKDRELALAAFRTGELNLLLCTVGAGGEGIDGMQVADTAIFLQRPWSAVLNAQAEDRLHRIGQQGGSVTYIDIIATGTVEERVLEALQEKAAKLKEVVGE